MSVLSYLCYSVYLYAIYLCIIYLSVITLLSGVRYLYVRPARVSFH